MSSPTLAYFASGAVHDPKARVKYTSQCPICHQKIAFGIEQSILEKAQHFPFPHVVLHGDPLHCCIAYIDADMRVRALEASTSIEILRRGETLCQILQKWSNPF